MCWPWRYLRMYLLKEVLTYYYVIWECTLCTRIENEVIIKLEILMSFHENYNVTKVVLITFGIHFIVCSYTLGGIASICFRFHIQQTLRMHTQGCQWCQKTRNFVRNSKILIARSTIQPKLSKIKNNLPFFKEFWCIS